MSKQSVKTRIEAQEWLIQHKAEMKKKHGRGFDTQALANCINDASGLHLSRQAYDAIARKVSLPRLETAQAIMTYRDIMERKTRHDVVKSDKVEEVLLFLNGIDIKLAEVVELLKKKITPA